MWIRQLKSLVIPVGTTVNLLYWASAQSPPETHGETVTGVAVMHTELLHGEHTCWRSLSLSSSHAHTQTHTHGRVRTHCSSTSSPDGHHTGSVNQFSGGHCEGGKKKKQLVICDLFTSQWPGKVVPLISCNSMIRLPWRLSPREEKTHMKQGAVFRLILR